LARAGEAPSPAGVAEIDPTQRAAIGAPGAAPAAPPAGEPALLLARQAVHAGCGALTGWGSWQAAGGKVMDLRVAPADAERLGLEDLAVVTLQSVGRPTLVRVRIWRDLGGGAMVLPEGAAAARALVPCRLEAQADAVVARPAAAAIEA